MAYLLVQQLWSQKTIPILMQFQKHYVTELLEQNYVLLFTQYLKLGKSEEPSTNKEMTYY